jgi:hypothetical protein
MPKPTTRLANIEPPRKLLTSAQRDRARVRAFRPLAIELGWLVYEWNRLQAALADLFADIVCKGDSRVPLAIWHTINSERDQRRMLQAAIDATYILESPKPRAHDDISWILKQLNTLAGRRNDAIHSPLVFITQLDAAGQMEGVDILPMYFFGNPRAAQLKDKSLLQEFKWYRDHLGRLAHFAETLHFALVFPDFSWPDRPQLPPVGQFHSRAAKRRKNKSK